MENNDELLERVHKRMEYLGWGTAELVKYCDLSGTTAGRITQKKNPQLPGTVKELNKLLNGLGLDARGEVMDEYEDIYRKYPLVEALLKAIKANNNRAARTIAEEIAEGFAEEGEESGKIKAGGK